MPQSAAEKRAAKATRSRSRVLIDGRLVATQAAKHDASTYNNWDCRCETCTAAHVARMRDYRNRTCENAPTQGAGAFASRLIGEGIADGPGRLR